MSVTYIFWPCLTATRLFVLLIRPCLYACCMDTIFCLLVVLISDKTFFCTVPCEIAFQFSLYCGVSASFSLYESYFYFPHYYSCKDALCAIGTVLAPRHSVLFAKWCWEWCYHTHLLIVLLFDMPERWAWCTWGTILDISMAQVWQQLFQGIVAIGLPSKASAM